MQKKITIDAQKMAEQAPLLHAGDQVLLSGVIYTARDQAHKRIRSLMQAGKVLPFPLHGATVYYAGPTPTPLNLPIGACGPTTSGRMDPYTPALLDAGLKGMIGKGGRSEEVCQAICRNKAVYLCAVGGAGALAAQCVKQLEVVAFPELGCESVKRLTVQNFPLLVAIDCHGGSLFADR